MDKFVTIRTLLVVATIRGWNLCQFDVNNIFLYGDLDEDVYMELQPNESNISSNEVYKLVFYKLCTSLYGLKQASRQWYFKLPDFISK